MAAGKNYRVEGLIILLLFGILAAMVLPAVSRAVDETPQAVCLNNLKILGAAFQMYVADNNGYYPPSHAYPTGRSNAGPRWHAFIMPYIGKGGNLTIAKEKVFACPSDQLPRKYSAKTPCSYASNSQLIGGNEYDPYNDHGKIVVRESMLRAPAQNVILLCEFVHAENVLPWPYQLPAGFASAEPHEGKGNFLFCDGHAAAFANAETHNERDKSKVKYDYPTWNVWEK